MFFFDKEDKNEDILITLEKLIENWEKDLQSKTLSSYLITIKKESANIFLQ